MPEGLIDMQDMEVIFSVTDTMGIHRESVRVDLAKEDPGSIGKGAGGLIEITIPESKSIRGCDPAVVWPVGKRRAGNVSRCPPSRRWHQVAARRLMHQLILTRIHYSFFAGIRRLGEN